MFASLCVCRVYLCCSVHHVGRMEPAVNAKKRIKPYCTAARVVVHVRSRRVCAVAPGPRARAAYSISF